MLSGSLWLIFVFLLNVHLMVSEDAKKLTPEEVIEHYDESKHQQGAFDHEAVLGSEKQAEEFLHLEPEIAKAQLGLLIDRMDLNSDKMISREELLEWIMTSFKKLDRESAAIKFQEADENEDKKLAWQEYIHRMYGYTTKDLESMQDQKEPHIQNLVQTIDDEKRKFVTADLNKDGSLDLEEFTAFTHPHNYLHMADYESERAMKDFDKNNDGVIDFKEFMGEAESVDSPTSDAEKQYFREFDKDNNGSLDKKEIVKWIMPSFEDTAKYEVDHLFQESDRDKDNQLTKDEILDKHDVWVGSQATDYGKHLQDMIKTEL